MAFWDLIRYFPNYDLAKTCDLVSGANRFRFIFPDAFSPLVGGPWGRSTDPSLIPAAWQEWDASGMTYRGAFLNSLGNASWVVGPSQVQFTRVIDGSIGLNFTFNHVVGNKIYSAPGVLGTPTIQNTTSRVIAEEQLLSGEPALHLSVYDLAGLNGEEFWVVNAIAVESPYFIRDNQYGSPGVGAPLNGGVAPGIRRYVVVVGGSTTLDQTYTKWSPKL